MCAHGHILAITATAPATGIAMTGNIMQSSVASANKCSKASRNNMNADEKPTLSLGLKYT